MTAAVTLAPIAAWGSQPIAAVLFDLDGTLLDTATDIAAALNRALVEHGWSALPVSQVMRLIGRGSPSLIERAAAAQGRVSDEAERARLLARFFYHYADIEDRGESSARLYPGVERTLRRLHTAGLKLAVVTNKHHRFADALLRRLDLLPYFEVLVGGDTCDRRKPDPQPLLFACNSLGVALAQAVMVGDSSNDVTAARAAHIPVLCVPYGYNEGADPQSLACDALMNTLDDLPALLHLREV